MILSFMVNGYIKFLSFVSFLKDAGNFLLNLLIFCVVLGLIVGIHELGHFLFARRANVLCREYAIGMGPRLWKKRKGETVYSLRALPLGGFCAIAGEEVEPDPFAGIKQIKLQIVDGVVKSFYPEIDDEKIAYPVYNIVSYDIYDEKQTGDLYIEVEKDEVTTRYPVDPKAIIYTKKDEFQIAPYNRTLGAKGKGARALVMFGGPLMNFLLAIVIYFIAALFTGFANTDSNVLGDAPSGSSISEYYDESFSFDDLGLIDSNKFYQIYCESIKGTNDIESFKSKYKDKGLEENIYVTYKRDKYLAKGDIITGLEVASLGEKVQISSWNDLTKFMEKYEEKKLAEPIKIYFTRDDVEMTVDATAFITINNLGIGSGWSYDPNTNAIVKALSTDFTSSSRGLGDNSGIKLGDTIMKIGSIENPTWTDVRKVLDSYVGNTDTEEDYVNMTVKHKDGTVEDIKVKPYSRELMENQTALDGTKPSITDATIGISPVTKFSLIKSLGYGFEKTWAAFTAVFSTLKLLFNNTVSVKNLSGPIGIFSITSQAREAGFTYILSLIGFLSVNIGLLNLFPIPALDGGRLVFVAYEAITKKKPNPKVETILITITFVLLLILMAFVAFEDIKSFF